MKTSINQVLEAEQAHLWNDLDQDLHAAANGFWSIGAESRIKRIIWIADVIGITPWQGIPMPLLSSGIYDVIRVKMGLPLSDYDLSTIKQSNLAYFPPQWMLTLKRIQEMTLESFEPVEDW